MRMLLAIYFALSLFAHFQALPLVAANFLLWHCYEALKKLCSVHVGGQELLVKAKNSA